MKVLKAVGAGPKRLVSYDVTPVRTPFVAGAGAVLLGTLPLISAGPITGLRGLTAAFCYLLGAALLFAGSAKRRRRSTLDLEKSQIRGPGRSGSLETATRIRLTSGIEVVKAAERAVYRVELCFGDGAAVIMAEGQDPGPVARAVRLLETGLALPVTSGWGLPDEVTPWEPSPIVMPLADSARSSLSGTSAGSHLIVRYSFDRIVSWIVSACAVLIGATTLILVSAGAAGSPVGPVLESYGLVSGMILLVLLVAAAAGTRHLRLTAAGSWMRVEWRTLGIPSGARVFPREGLGPAHPVRPTKDEAATHLLFCTAEGAVALPCPDHAQMEQTRSWLAHAASDRL